MRPLDSSAACAYVDSWLAQPFVQIPVPGKEHWRILHTLLESAGTAGTLTSDAHLAALAIEQAAVLHSTDHDFQRFRGLRHVNPLEGPRSARR